MVEGGIVGGLYRFTVGQAWLARLWCGMVVVRYWVRSTQRYSLSAIQPNTHTHIHTHIWCTHLELLGRGDRRVLVQEGQKGPVAYQRLALLEGLVPVLNLCVDVCGCVIRC